jgi:tetratricopeptide (TPR) repeat protein
MVRSRLSVIVVALMFIASGSMALAQFPENTQPVPATDADQSGITELEDITLNSLLRRGISRSRNEDYEGALSDFDEVLKHRSDNAEALVERGEALFNLQRFIAAEQDFEKYVAAKPDDPLGWNWLGSAQEQSGDLLGAAASYTKQLELDPDSVGAVRYRGDVYRKLGLAEEAIADYTKALAASSNDAQHLVYRGIAKLFGTEKLQEAIADFDRAIEIDPHASDDRVYLYRGLAHLRLEHNDEGNEDYETYTELQPDDFESDDIFTNATFKYLAMPNPKTAEEFLERGDKLKEIGYAQAAVFDYQRAAKLDPQNPDPLFELGLLYRSMEFYETAIDVLKKCVTVDDRYHQAFYQLAEFMRVDLDQNTESIPYYEKAIALKPDYSLAYGSLGVAKRDTGDKRAALAHLSRAIELNPENSFAIMERGETYRQLGDLDKALTDVTKGVDLAPKSAWSWRYRGRVKSARGDFDGALSDFNASLELYELASVYVDRGITYIRMGKPVEAQAQFDEALKRNSTMQIEIDAELARLKELADDK